MQTHTHTHLFWRIIYQSQLLLLCLYLGSQNDPATEDWSVTDSSEKDKTEVRGLICVFLNVHVNTVNLQ